MYMPVTIVVARERDRSDASGIAAHLAHLGRVPVTASLQLRVEFDDRVCKSDERACTPTCWEHCN